MRVSEISVKFTKDDLLDLLQEIIKLKDLSIDNLEMGRAVKISGSFKILFRIRFLISFEIEEVERKKLILRLTKVKVLGIPALKIIRKIILKKLLKDFQKSGIKPEKDKVFIELEGLLKDVKFLSVDIKEIQLTPGDLNITLQNVNINLKDFIGNKVTKGTGAKDDDAGELKTEVTEMHHDEVLMLSSGDASTGEKVKDVYTEGRSFVEERLPENVKPAEEYVFILPDIIALIVRLLRDERVSKSSKVAVIASLGYIAIPKDFVSDKIPLIGKLDDLAVALFALNRLINDVQTEVLLENWQGNDRNILVLKKALEYLKTFSAANDLDKFYSLINVYL